MTFTPESVVIIIGAVSLAIVNIITALKVKEIAHSVNSAATDSRNQIKDLTAQVASLTASRADEKKTAELLAQKAGPTKGTI